MLEKNKPHYRSLLRSLEEYKKNCENENSEDKWSEHNNNLLDLLKNLISDPSNIKGFKQFLNIEEYKEFELIHKKLRDDPKNIEIYLERNNFIKDHISNHLALFENEILIEMYPNDYKHYDRKIDLYSEDGYGDVYDYTLDTALKILELNPPEFTKSFIYGKIGKYYSTKNDYREALNYYINDYRLFPDDIDNVINLSKSLFKVGRYFIGFKIIANYLLMSKEHVGYEDVFDVVYETIEYQSQLELIISQKKKNADLLIINALIFFINQEYNKCFKFLFKGFKRNNKWTRIFKSLFYEIKILKTENIIQFLNEFENNAFTQFKYYNYIRYSLLAEIVKNEKYSEIIEYLKSYENKMSIDYIFLAIGNLQAGNIHQGLKNLIEAKKKFDSGKELIYGFEDEQYSVSKFYAKGLYDILFQCDILLFLRILKIYYELSHTYHWQIKKIVTGSEIDIESNIPKKFPMEFNIRRAEDKGGDIINIIKNLYKNRDENPNLYNLEIKYHIIKYMDQKSHGWDDDMLYNLIIGQDFNESYTSELRYFLVRFQRDIDETKSTIIARSEIEKAEAKVEERNRIIRSQAHNIKNILRSVIDPLTILQRTIHKPQIEEALKHAEIIREMVNATSLSYIGSTDDFFHDAKENENGISIKEMIITSIETSVGNIVEDIKYYSNFWEQYFPNNKASDKASDEYRLLQNIPQYERYPKLENFISKNMFDIDVKFRNSELFIMGNQKSSGVKMLTLINELIFNAVKYAAFVEKENRFLSITFGNNKQKINFKIENSYKELTMAKTTGTGNLIIDNLIEIMNGKVIQNKKTKKNIYVNEVQLPNFWEAQ